MAELEFGIENLLNKRRIESNRVEFKASWTPDDIYRSVCAFANDYDNVGGGYIVIGVEEKDGVAVRPVKGIKEDDIDNIQKKIVGFNNTMVPAYFPQVLVEKVDGRWIIVIWAMVGIQRPYRVPERVTARNDKKLYYYIRYGTSSVKANYEQERELINMTSYAPFDTRPNFDATEKDISVALLREHLTATKSKLANQVRDDNVMEILEDMQLLVGPPEQRYIQNVALMMFCDHAYKFFPYSQVEITKFSNGSRKDPDHFTEVPAIKDSVPNMIRRTMEKLQDMAIVEKVSKVDGQMEADRRFSYPYRALEEAVVNAFYHRDYQSNQPVTIDIEPDRVVIVNFPGIDRSISDETIEKGERFVSRYYRNKRLGEFLKELDLTEGKSTGIPTIQNELRENGSPKATISTDEWRHATTVEIPIHPDFLPSADEGNETINREIKTINGTMNGKNGTMNGENGTMNGENGTMNGENGTMNGENETINGENGTMNDTIKSEIELTEFESNLIALLKENGAYTRKMLAEAMNCAERTVSRAIDQLKENHVIYRVGSRRDGYWAVVDFSNRSRPASSAKETKATDDSSDTTKSDDF